MSEHDAVTYLAKNVIKNRALAKDKSYQWETRLMFDRQAARGEELLISWANKYEAQRAIIDQTPRQNKFRPME